MQTMVLGALFTILVAFANFAFSLHSSEAGVVDWHKPLIGVPHTSSASLAPTFHRFSSGLHKKSTQSVILTATSSNVLAALDAITGDISWRYTFDPSEPIVGFRANGDVVSALSGPGGATYRSFSIHTGALLAETRLHEPDTGRLFDPIDLGTHMSFPEINATAVALDLESVDVFILSNGDSVKRVNTLNGKIKWEWKLPGQGASVIHSQIAHTSTAVYVIGLIKTRASYTLHVTALSASTGAYLASAQIPSQIRDGLTDFLVLSPPLNHSPDKPAVTYPHVVWLDQGNMHFAPLTPELDGKVKHIKGTTYKRILNVGLNEIGWFVALKSDGSGLVMRFDEDSMGLKMLWEFSESATSERYTDSHYTGGFDNHSRPYVGRVFWSHHFGLGSSQIFAAHGAEGTGLVRGRTFPFNTGQHGIIMHAALDAAYPSENFVVARFMLTTSTGTMQLWQEDRMQWTREEALAEIGVSEFVELPELKASTSRIGDGWETFDARISRQFSDARDFPTYLINFIKRFATGSYASVSAPTSQSAGASNTLTRDTFGFRKLIVAATARGVVYGLDSSTGTILWSRILDLGWAAAVGAHHVPLKLFVIRTVGDEEGEDPQVVLVTQRFADNGLVDTVVFHINALTGADAQRESSAGGMLVGTDIVQGEVVDSFLLREGKKQVVLVDKFLQVHLFPETDENRDAFVKVANKIHFALLGPGRVHGHRVVPQVELTGKFTAYSTWTTMLQPGEVILSKFVRPVEPVASLGKVLGDRRTLYKYLNPHLIGILTVIPPMDSESDQKPTCGIYLLDDAKGSIVYHATVSSTHGGVCQVHAVLAENWLLYTYYDEDVTSTVQAKGQRVVSVELYEGNEVNEKTRSSDSSIYYEKNVDITVYEQAFVFPTGISALTTTSTKFGIATKDLIVANERGQVQSFPRRMFDPRRPNRKVTAEEQEEWLVQYDPLIPDDSRRVLSHNYRTSTLHTILSTPSQLESTSLIFTYGHADLFSTRTAPSGGTFDVLSESFNKVQLVLTVVGLVVAIGITRPMVRSKRVREVWY